MARPQGKSRGSRLDTHAAFILGLVEGGTEDISLAEIAGPPFPWDWLTTTVTTGLRLSGMTAPMLLDGAVNGTTFLAYVEQVLVPRLSTGDFVALDTWPAQ